jgi:cysteine-rich repeat protein
MPGSPETTPVLRWRRVVASGPATLVWVLALGALEQRARAAIVDVDEAVDVCPAAENPCLIAEPVSVKSGSTLDFGLSEVRIVTGGSLQVGAGVVEILCGSFTASTPGATAVLARGASPLGGQDGGMVSIEARGRCGADGRTACFVDEDCPVGACAKGGGVSLGGGIEAQGLVAGSLSIQAAGDVTLADDIDLDSTDANGDGGQLEVSSTLGSVAIGGRIEATAGRFGFGGIVTISGARDVSVGGMIDASGGDFDGGEIDIEAGGDLTVGGRLRADSTAGEGGGGFVALTAAGDLALSSTAVLSADGHQSVENFGGDGGTFLFSAGGDLLLAPGGRVVAAGARPDGAGGTIDASSEGAATLAGEIAILARGTRGIGGSLAIRGCEIEIPATAVLTNTGDGGENIFTGRRSVAARAGASITADAHTGTNSVQYRDANRPPLLLARFVPLPLFQLVPELPRCADETTTTTQMSGACGDGLLSDGEDCDDGDARFVRGDACGPTCRWVDCADPDASGAVNASDALVLLRVAVGLEICDPCVCNVDSSGGPVGASDALRTLSVAVGLPVALLCTSCAAP